MIEEGYLIDTTEVAPSALRDLPYVAAHVVTHPLLPFLSHPYEWPFALLHRAALFHLDMNLRLLDLGYTPWI